MFKKKQLGTKEKKKTNVFTFLFTVKHVVPQSLSPPGSVPWQTQQQQQQQQQSQGPPSPSSISSGSISPSYSPSRTLDLSGSSTSFSSDRKAPYYWTNGPVPEWSKDQVCLLIIL